MKTATVLQSIRDDCGRPMPHRIPLALRLLDLPQVFAYLRWRGTPERCLSCDPSSGVVRIGLRKHGPNRIQRYRCASCHAAFNEYSQTPLEGTSLTAKQWFAIWHWRHQEGVRRLTVRKIAALLGMKPYTVQWFARHAQCYKARRGFRGPRTFHRKNPGHVFGRTFGYRIFAGTQDPAQDPAQEPPSPNADSIILHLQYQEDRRRKPKVPAPGFLQPTAEEIVTPRKSEEELSHEYHQKIRRVACRKWHRRHRKKSQPWMPWTDPGE